MFPRTASTYTQRFGSVHPGLIVWLHCTEFLLLVVTCRSPFINTRHIRSHNVHKCPHNILTHFVSEWLNRFVPPVRHLPDPNLLSTPALQQNLAVVPLITMGIQTMCLSFFNAQVSVFATFCIEEMPISPSPHQPSNPGSISAYPPSLHTTLHRNPPPCASDPRMQLHTLHTLENEGPRGGGAAVLLPFRFKCDLEGGRGGGDLCNPPRTTPFGHHRPSLGAKWGTIDDLRTLRWRTFFLFFGADRWAIGLLCDAPLEESTNGLGWLAPLLSALERRADHLAGSTSQHDLHDFPSIGWGKVQATRWLKLDGLETKKDHGAFKHDTSGS